MRIVPVDTPAMCRAMAPVFCEMLAHYHQSPEDERAVARFLSASLLDTGRTGRMLAALAPGGAVMALASYALVLPGGGMSPELFLKELYTARARRGCGAGKALMRELAIIARREGCGRMRWTTGRDDSYHAARRLYESIGGEVQEGAILYALHRDAIASLADA